MISYVPDIGWLMVPLVGFVVACASVPLVIRLAKAVGAVDRPAHRKRVSRRVVPKLGGLSIALGFLAAVALGFLLSKGGVQSQWPLILTACGAGLAMLLLGAIDDVVDLSARTKLAVQLVVAILVVQGMGVAGFTHVGPFLGVSFDLGWTAVPISIIWIVGITNAVNLIDGVDGLAAATSFLTALAVAMIAVAAGNVPVAVMAGGLAGALLGFLPFNFRSARVFLGDTGSQSIGMMLAILSMTAPVGTVGEGKLIVPVLLLGYPILDTMIVIARRLLSGKSVFGGDLSHIHHRMLVKGMNHGQITLWLCALTTLFCYAGVSNAIGNLTWSLVALGALAIGLILAALRLGYPSHLSVRQLRRHSGRFILVRDQARLAISELRVASGMDAAIETIRSLGEKFAIERIVMHLQVNEDGSDEDEVQPAAATRRQRIVLDLETHGPLPGEDDPAVENPRQENQADGDPSGAAVQEELHFPTTGLTVRYRVRKTGQLPELQLERRVQMARVFKALSGHLRNGMENGMGSGPQAIPEQQTPPESQKDEPLAPEVAHAGRA
jgi:UDP-GlcNAc:undecaprenyl-phosphate GlcNAc-1-phosphate transferase